MPDNRRQQLALILDHSRAIQKLAKENGFDFVAYLLDMVVQEASLKMTDREDQPAEEKKPQTAR